MKDRFYVQFTKSKRQWDLSDLWHTASQYLKKVFFYAGAQIRRRKKSYRAMFVVSIVMLSFIFTNLLLNEARILGDLANQSTGSYHVFFLSVDGTQAKGAVEDKRVKESLILPVIARLESSTDASEVGKVAVLTEEAIRFLHIDPSFGSLPGDDEILVPKQLYGFHTFLELGEEQELYFTGGSKYVLRPMTVSGLYENKDSRTGYVFVNEATGEKLAEACGYQTTFDVYLTLKYSSDRNAGRVAHDLVQNYGIRSSETQKVLEGGAEWQQYQNYINRETANYRFTNGSDLNSLIIYPAIVLAALIMASFMNSYTERHLMEYGVLASYGAKRRHLFGVILGQVLYITALSLVPVLLVSIGVVVIYALVRNAYAYGSFGSVSVGLPIGRLFLCALLYVLALVLISYLMTRRLLSQQVYPMIRGAIGGKGPVVRRSSARLSKVKDKIRWLSFLQSLRTIRHSLVTALATSLICGVIALFVGYNLLMQAADYQSERQSYEDQLFSGVVRAIDGASYVDGYFRGFVSEKDREALASTDGVVMAGGFRNSAQWQEDGSVYLPSYAVPQDVRVLVDETHSLVTDEVFQFFSNAKRYIEQYANQVDDHRRELERQVKAGYEASFAPYYCDESMLPYLCGETLEGRIEDLFALPDRVILVVDDWADDEAHYHAGDVLAVSGEKEGGEVTRLELTVAAVVKGTFLEIGGSNLVMDGGSLLMTPETGEKLDGFPAELYTKVFFRLDPTLAGEERKEAEARVLNGASQIRYDVSLYSNSLLQVNRLSALDNGTMWVFFAALYLTLCVFDYYHASESILSQRREYCTLRQIGVKEKDLYKTTRCSVYAGQLLSVVFTFVFMVAACCINAWTSANTANYYRMLIHDPAFLEEMLAKVMAQQTTNFFMIFGVMAIALVIHVLAAMTAVAGTIPPTRQLLKENIAATLKGDAEI